MAEKLYASLTIDVPRFFMDERDGKEELLRVRRLAVQVGNKLMHIEVVLGDGQQWPEAIIMGAALIQLGQMVFTLCDEAGSKEATDSAACIE